MGHLTPRDLIIFVFRGQAYSILGEAQRARLHAQHYYVVGTYGDFQLEDMIWQRCSSHHLTVSCRLQLRGPAGSHQLDDPCKGVPDPAKVGKPVEEVLGVMDLPHTVLAAPS